MIISPRLFKIFELEAHKRIFKALKVVQELFRRDLVCKRKRERKDHEQVQELIHNIQLIESTSAEEKVKKQTFLW